MIRNITRAACNPPVAKCRLAPHRETDWLVKNHNVIISPTVSNFDRAKFSNFYRFCSQTLVNNVWQTGSASARQNSTNRLRRLRFAPGPSYRDFRLPVPLAYSPKWKFLTRMCDCASSWIRRRQATEKVIFSTCLSTPSQARIPTRWTFPTICRPSATPPEVTNNSLAWFITSRIVSFCKVYYNLVTTAKIALA